MKLGRLSGKACKDYKGHSWLNAVDVRYIFNRFITMAANLEAVRDVQHGQIDDSVVPGTVHLVDLDHSMQAKHSKAQQDIVLVPTPSDDPDDPVSDPWPMNHST